MHSIDGYDEVSLTGSFKLFSNNQDLMLEPKDLGFNVIDSVKLSGGKNIKESSKIFLDILKNKGTSEQVDAVLANSGLAIYCAKKLNSIKEIGSYTAEIRLHRKVNCSIEFTVVSDKN